MKDLTRKPPYRLPTILGLMFLLVSLFAAVFLIKSNQQFFLKADPEIVPNQVKITNITDTSFTVSWVTSKETSGFVKIEKTQGAMTFADDRNQLSGEIGQFTTHYVTVKNLFPVTKYFFRIGSGGKIFDDQGKLYEVTTGPTISQAPPAADPAFGRVETTDGQPVEGAIVFVSLPNTILQSALVKQSGNWLVTLSLARSADLSGYASYDRQASVGEIFVQGGSLGTATATFTTQADSPAPTLVLGGRDVSLLEASQPTPTESLVPTIIPTSTPSVSQASGFQVEMTLSPTAIPQSQIELEISYPVEGELVSTAKPEFFGKGPQESSLTIILNSQSYFGQVITDQQGNWSWSPPESLEPGGHTLLVRYQDEQGQTKTVEHRFTVLAAGESELPSFTSTPSASPTLNLFTPTPTLPPRTTQPSTEPGIPQPGVLTPTFLVSIIGMGIFLMGIFLKRGF